MYVDVRGCYRLWMCLLVCGCNCFCMSISVFVCVSLSVCNFMGEFGGDTQTVCQCVSVGVGVCIF